MESLVSPWKRISVLVLGGLVAIGLPGVALGDCKLTAGYELEPPYHYPDSNGTIIGIDAEILITVLEEIGCRVNFKVRPWKRTLLGIEHGKLDIALGASFKTERAAFAYYSPPYRGQPHVIFETANRAKRPASLESFLKAGHTIGTVHGWHYTNGIRKFLDDPIYRSQVVIASSIDGAMKMLDRGRFQGFLANPSSVAGMIGKQELLKRYVMTRADIDILHYLFSRKSVAADIAARFNRRLKEKLAAGLFFRICKKFETKLLSQCSFLATAAADNPR